MTGRERFPVSSEPDVSFEGGGDLPKHSKILHLSVGADAANMRVVLTCEQI